MRERLIAAGFNIEIILHDEILPKTADDLQWTQWAANEGAVAFTCDLFRNEYQRTALENFPGIVVIFPELRVELTRDHIIHAWPKIMHLFTNRKTGCYKYSAVNARLTRRWN